jgi:hypothetical protein
MIKEIEDYFVKESFLREPPLYEDGPYGCLADLSPLEHLYGSIKKISDGEELSEIERQPLMSHFNMLDELRAEAHELLLKVINEQKTLRSLVESLVIYAENLPVGEYEKACGARGIAEALLAKGYNDYIPSAVKKEFSGRLDALKDRPLPEKKTAYIAPPSDETSENKPQNEHRTEEEPPTTDNPTNISATQGSPKEVIRKGDYLIFPSLEQQQYWAQLFVDFLRAHNKSQETLSTKLSNYVNRVFACFYHQWKKSNLLNTNPYNKAYTMFLVNDCGITGIAEKTYSNNVKRILDEAFEQNSSMQIEIESIVKKEVEQLTS